MSKFVSGLRYIGHSFSLDHGQSPLFWHGLWHWLWSFSNLVPGNLGAALRWWIGTKSVQAAGTLAPLPRSQPHF